MRRPIKKRNTLTPDLQYGSTNVTKFINYIMRDGEKQRARRVLYDAFEDIRKRTEQEPLEVFEMAIKNVGPNMEVRSRRVGGANYQVPREVRPERKLSLALRWLHMYAKARRGGGPFAKALADELIDASNNEGEAVRKREQVHKMAEANKAFAHFA